MKRIALVLLLPVLQCCTVFDPNAPATKLDYLIVDVANVLGDHDPLGPRWNYGEHTTERKVK